jgi:hypothetical protein
VGDGAKLRGVIKWVQLFWRDWLSYGFRMG